MKPADRLKEIEFDSNHDGKISYQQSTWLINRVKELTETLEWIMPKVHQGSHEGEFGTCMKATCVEYRKALESEK